MQLTQQDIDLMILIMDNLRIYTTDDNFAEMEEDMKQTKGIADFSEEMDLLHIKLKAMK